MITYPLVSALETTREQLNETRNTKGDKPMLLIRFTSYNTQGKMNSLVAQMVNDEGSNFAGIVRSIREKLPNAHLQVMIIRQESEVRERGYTSKSVLYQVDDDFDLVSPL